MFTPSSDTKLSSNLLQISPSTCHDPCLLSFPGPVHGGVKLPSTNWLQTAQTMGSLHSSTSDWSSSWLASLPVQQIPSCPMRIHWFPHKPMTLSSVCERILPLQSCHKTIAPRSYNFKGLKSIFSLAENTWNDFSCHLITLDIRKHPPPRPTSHAFEHALPFALAFGLRRKRSIPSVCQKKILGPCASPPVSAVSASSEITLASLASCLEKQRFPTMSRFRFPTSAVTWHEFHLPFDASSQGQHRSDRFSRVPVPKGKRKWSHDKSRLQVD